MSRTLRWVVKSWLLKTEFLHAKGLLYVCLFRSKRFYKSTVVITCADSQHVSQSKKPNVVIGLSSMYQPPNMFKEHCYILLVIKTIYDIEP